MLTVVDVDNIVSGNFVPDIKKLADELGAHLNRFSGGGRFLRRYARLALDSDFLRSEKDNQSRGYRTAHRCPGHAFAERAGYDRWADTR